LGKNSKGIATWKFHDNGGNVWFQKISVPTPFRSMEIQRGRGPQTRKLFLINYFSYYPLKWDRNHTKVNWNFQRGFQIKNLPWWMGTVDVFKNNTIKK